MKKLIGLFFAFAMMLSMVFVSEAISSENPFAAKAQTVAVKKKRKGIIRSTYAGGKYVVRKTWDGTKWVSKKVWVGTKYAGKKTAKGAKWTAHKTKRGTKAVISRTKKIVY
jgi:hypothetical protein